MTPPDEELVLTFQNGDVSVFDELVRRWNHKIQGAIYRIMGSDEEARDLCQEAFLKAYRALPGFKREARFSSWLYQIALNLCRDRMRRRKGRVFLSLDEMSEHEQPPPAKGPSALDLVEARDLARTVEAAVAALAPEQREVIILKEYQELTFLEIATILDLPLSTVKTRLYRGLGQLRTRLERSGVRNTAPVPASLP